MSNTIKWQAAEGSWRANFNQVRFYQLGRRGKIYFALTLSGLLFELVYTFFGVFFFVIGLLGLLLSFHNSSLIGVFIAVFYLLIMLFWLSFSLKSFLGVCQPVYFDLARGVFIKGWRPWFYNLRYGGKNSRKTYSKARTKKATKQPETPIAILDIIGLQLLSKGFRHRRDKTQNYDINLILNNHSRLHVASYFNEARAQGDIQKLSTRLGVRIVTD